MTPARVPVAGAAWEVRHGDALSLLRGIDSESIHAVVTSPPYWALRRYGAGPQELGSEATSEAYLAAQVAVFREVRRVLREDGTCWINLGDTYEGGGKGTGASGALSPKQRTSPGSYFSDRADLPAVESGAGNLVGIPERLALTLQADGWTWRSTVIWAKPAPMPESVAGWRWERCRVKTVAGDSHHHHQEEAGRVAMPSMDKLELPEWADCPGCDKCAANDGLVLRKGSWRPTRSHEVILMMTKGMGYYADQEAVKEESDYADHVGRSVPRGGFNGRTNALEGREAFKAFTSTRNPRTVQTWGPEPLGKIAAYSAPVDVAHYAAFPLALPTWCIKASTPERGCCASCGAPWARVVSAATGGASGKGSWVDHSQDAEAGRMSNTHVHNGSDTATYKSGETLGWRPTCTHGGEPVGAMVLDPYSGTATTGVAALQLGRRYIGLELREEYVALSRSRIVADAPMFNGTEARR